VDPLIPAKLDWHRGTPLGAAWLRDLPRLVAECAEQWELELEPPFANGMVAYCAPAGDVVLKINYPDDESEHEADALAHWDGDGAVRLLARDDDRRALLVERCLPGTSLWELDEDDALAVAIELFPKLWKPPAAASPFRLLQEDAERWGVGELGRTQGELVVVHQDLQGSNVLRSERGWLAIDAKPRLGEREFDLASLIRDRRFAFDPAVVRRRLDVLTGALGLDRERTRLWAIAHARAWAWGADEPAMLACAAALEAA
jgi:streptomycin 6-kinase